MAHLYADEDFDFRVVLELRRLGHDVLTVQEAGHGNQSIGDADVLDFATSQDRAVLTFNRRDFIKLHRMVAQHRGIVVCTRDADPFALASRIHQEVFDQFSLETRLVRVNRP